MPAVRISQQSPASEKISLFHSLYRGRDDVYPRRFESRRTGKSGYQPACANEWVRGICDKPRVKCLDCPSRRFLPITDDVMFCADAQVAIELDGPQHLADPDAYRRDRRKDYLLQE